MSVKDVPQLFASRWAKHAVGICSVLPLVALALLVVLGTRTTHSMWHGANAAEAGHSLVEIAALFLLASAVAEYCAASACLVQLWRCTGFDASARTTWTMLLVFATILALPVFWYLYLRESGSSVGNAEVVPSKGSR